MTMEGEFVMKNCREILGNPDSVAWELWENKRRFRADSGEILIQLAHYMMEL